MTWHYLQVADDHFEKAVRNPVRAAATEAANARHDDEGEPDQNASIRQEKLSVAKSDTYTSPIYFSCVIHRVAVMDVSRSGVSLFQLSAQARSISAASANTPVEIAALTQPLPP